LPRFGRRLTSAHPQGLFALEFEYRKPEVEAALREARTVEALEAALNAAIGLVGDLGAPDVYGWKLLCPALDAEIPAIARRLGLVDLPNAKSNENVCIVATQIYARGGHSKVAGDISSLIGADRTTLVMTDVYRKLNPMGMLGVRAQPSPLKRRADVLLRGASLAGKILELFNILAAIRPTRIFMLTHHFDIVAAVALWPFRDVVEFLHHADHVPAIGATVAYSEHVDLTWTCHKACLAAGLPAAYAGMTALRADRARSPPPAHAGRLRIATCGPAAKYKGRATFAWSDFAIAALRRGDVDMVHVGPADEELKSAITSGLREAGLDPQLYDFAGETPDLVQALIDQGAGAYLASYPVSGGKAIIEAQSIGLPTFVPVDSASPPLLQFDLPGETWTRVGSPAELSAALATMTPTALGAASAANPPEPIDQFEQYVLGPANPAG